MNLLGLISEKPITGGIRNKFSLSHFAQTVAFLTVANSF